MPPTHAETLHRPGPKIDKAIASILESDETVLAVVRRHLIGLVYWYLETLLGVTALALLISFVAPEFFSDLTAQENLMLSILLLLFVALVVFILILITNIYLTNKIIITNKAVLQVLQRGPFGQKISRLSMADVEDVTSKQEGLLQTIFNYGELRIETAGELRNFEFPYCPDPNRYALLIGEARQKYAETFGSD